MNNLTNNFIYKNTTYEISSILDLNGNTLSIPENCTLHFNEGSKIINGIISLNNTQFTGSYHCIETPVNGIQYELNTDYFDLLKNNKTLIMQSIIDTAKCIQLHGEFINVFDNITLGNNDISIIGNGSSIINNNINKALNINGDKFVRITDINFEVTNGCAIYKNATRTTVTRLSFLIDKCHFVGKGNTQNALIDLVSSREGNISNCYFQGPGKSGYIGINRTNAINTNIIGCLFSDLTYGIKAGATHLSADGTDVYTSFACGLNVQSAIMLGCKYGISIEGNDSFFLNTSMIDFCDNPLVITSQDGANITNNYFSTSTLHNDYDAVITIQNKVESLPKNANKRIIIENNTIYGHRTNKCYGIYMDAESEDCTIQGNTFDFFTDHGIYLKHNNIGNGWTIEKLVIDNNRFHFAYDNADAIGGFNGEQSIIISNNYAMELSNTKLMGITDPHGYYLYSQNHDYLYEIPEGNTGDKTYYAARRNNTRMKIGLMMTSNTLTIDNPLKDSSIVVYIANNRYPICVYSITNENITFTKTTEENVSFTAIIELILNI